MGTTYEKDPLAVRRRHGPERWLWTLLALVLIGLVVFVIARLYAQPDEGSHTLPASDRSTVQVDDDAYVRVTGPARRCDPAAFEEELGSDLEDGLFRHWAGRPAIVTTASDALEGPSCLLAPAGGKQSGAATRGRGAPHAAFRPQRGAAQPRYRVSPRSVHRGGSRGRRSPRNGDPRTASGREACFYRS